MTESRILGPVLGADPAISRFVVRGDIAVVEPTIKGKVGFLLIFSLAFEALLLWFFVKGMMDLGPTLLMCVGYGLMVALMLLMLRHQNRKGPWVICNLKDRTVYLPRIDTSLKWHEFSWVYVEEWRGRGMVDSHLIGELQVLFTKDERNVRLPAFTFFAIEAFERANQLAEVTGMPLSGTTEVAL